VNRLQGGCLCGKVRIEATDTPNQLQPSYELWTIRRECWLPAFVGVKSYERNRDGGNRIEP
jgi:hypothetical protein